MPITEFCLVPNVLRTRPRTAFADVFIRRMGGGGQSTLVGTSEGDFYVVKFANGPQGPNTIFNEAFGTILALHLGLPMPDWSPVYLSQSLIRRNAAFSFETGSGTRAVSPGLHFGSKFVLGSRDDEVYDVVPHTWMERLENAHFFAGALLLDLWAENVDLRQVLFLEGSESRTLSAIFIDQGHMFGGPFGNKRIKVDHSNLYYQRNIYKRAFDDGYVRNFLFRIEAMNENILQALLERVPLEWRTATLDQHAISLLLRNKEGLRTRAEAMARRFLN
ncbi:MAG TPA: HipA family kinase [Acidobacteriaceae bacterium]|nr:HipA family kinase [Acidobacteriaceae bacterium]